MQRTERDYRELLRRAQEAVEQIDALLAALKDAPQADAATLERATHIGKTLRTVERELEQLWDGFKRLQAGGGVPGP